ncbi:MAG: CDP-alcohol phosphatidyltransferase family protein, partial [Planctomycetota bacterium]
VASATDWFDGYIAREYGLTTVLGRIADPFVDKILVCGTFASLVVIKESFITPYLVVTVIAREFLVSGIRSFLEGRGKEFGAIYWGKVKVCVQYFFIGWVLFYLAYLRESVWAVKFTKFSVIIVLLVTVMSGIVYVIKGAKLLSQEEDAQNSG